MRRLVLAMVLGISACAALAPHGARGSLRAFDAKFKGALEVVDVDARASVTPKLLSAKVSESEVFEVPFSRDMPGPIRWSSRGRYIAYAASGSMAIIDRIKKRVVFQYSPIIDGNFQGEFSADESTFAFAAGDPIKDSDMADWNVVFVELAPEPKFKKIPTRQLDAFYWNAGARSVKDLNSNRLIKNPFALVQGATNETAWKMQMAGHQNVFLADGLARRFRIYGERVVFDHASRSADGRFEVVFQVTDGEGRHEVLVLLDHWWNATVPITGAQDGIGGSPSISPDGKWVAFIGDSKCWIMGLQIVQARFSVAGELGQRQGR